MASHTVYFNKDVEANFAALFEHMKRIGDIPANADDPGPYKAQVIAYALQQALEAIRRDERKQ